MKKTLTYHITTPDISQTVEQFLRKQGYSKHLLIRLKQSPMGLSVGGEAVCSNHRLCEGEILEVRLEESADSQHIVPTAMALDIVYEDEDLLVINKPAGLPIHPSQGHYEYTLANGMAYYFRQKGEPFICRVVNRLDRDTTGLLIVARHGLSSAILSEMVKNRQIHREYLAVVSGITDAGGCIDAPIARAEDSTIMRTVDLIRGERACTRYRLVFYNPEIDCSLVALTLETGRTHQIRVHMNYIGHPLLGDFLYNPDYRFIRRQTLHSHRLAFEHPITKEPMTFESELPEDMKFIYPFDSLSYKKRTCS